MGQSIMKWFDGRFSSALRDMTERVRTAVECAKFQQCQRDPSEAVLRFILHIVAALGRKNASSVVENTDFNKLLVEKLVTLLEPPELRERISDSRECWTAEL